MSIAVHTRLIIGFKILGSTKMTNGKVKQFKVTEGKST